ncbi:MAG: type II toxin-antitoxin system VapC family toxin [Chloroflexota bacterium]
MNVIDSSGWIEYFNAEENADFFTPPIRDVERLIVPTICLYEVFKRLLVERDEDSALLSVGLMSHGLEVALNRKIALEAAQVSRKFRLAMADSIIFATARIYHATLWTQDEHFKNIEGVRYIEKKYK